MKVMETIKQLPRYAAYKDAGVEWLGEIPEHWEVMKLDVVFNERRLKVSDKDFPPLSVTKKGVVPQLSTAAKTNDGDNRKGVFKGDFVINSRSDRKGSSGLAYQNGSVSLINIVIQPIDIVPKYCEFLLKSYSFIEEFYRNGHGIVADLWTTKYDDMKGIKIPLPSEKEQKAIAAFLDRKCAQIDRAVAQKERMIALLQERQQILVQRVVTRGLEKGVKMKDSGVAWIGEVPEAWELRRAKYILKQSKLKPDKNDGVVTAFRDGEVTLRTNRRTAGFTVAILEQGYQKVLKGQLVINSMDAFAGAIGVSDSNGKCTPEYVVCDPVSSDILPEYFAYLLREMALAKYIQVICNAVRERAIRIRYNTLAKLLLVIPPIEEQHKIVQFIQTQAQRSDKAIALQAAQIERLKEYKATLVDSVVRGQIKVC